MASLSERCMRSWRPFSLGVAGRMRSGRMPRRTHHVESWLRPPAASEAKGAPLSVRRVFGQAVRSKHPLEPGLDGIGGHAAQSAALQDEAAVVVGKGQGVAALAAGEPEVALEVGAPALRRGAAGDQGMRVRGDAAAFASLPYQAVSLEDVGSGAVGRPGIVGLQARSRSMTFLGPKLWCASFICTMRSAISGAVASGCRWGLRERS